MDYYVGDDNRRISINKFDHLVDAVNYIKMIMFILKTIRCKINQYGDFDLNIQLAISLNSWFFYIDK